MPSDVFTTAKRITERLGPIDAKLRPRAVEHAAYQVLLLTDGQIDQDDELAVGLVRVASRSAKPMEPDDLHALLVGAELQKAREVQQRSAADRVDVQLICLRAAAALIKSEPDGLGFPLAPQLMDSLRSLSEVGGHALTRESALLVLAAALLRLPQGERGLLVGVPWLRSLRAFARGDGAVRFVQCAALDAVVICLGRDAAPDLHVVLANGEGPYSMLTQHRAMQHLAALPLPVHERLEPILAQAQNPSEHVRQGIVQSLTTLARSNPGAFETIAEAAQADTCERVTGFAMLELAACTEQQVPGSLTAFTRLLTYCADSKSEVLQRCALAAIARTTRGETLAVVLGPATDALRVLLSSDAVDIVELAAAQAQELYVRAQAGGAELLEELKAAFAEHREGTMFEVVQANRELFFQACTVSACQDLPLQIHAKAPDRYLLQRGEPRTFRWWRLLYEIRHPGPDKRQSYLHAHARRPSTAVSTVPLRQAEVTPTRVPGERRTLVGQSWGCFLPRVDDLSAALLTPSGKQLLTPFGTLTIRGPAPAWARFKLRWALIGKHVRLCGTRDRALTAKSEEERRAYATALRRLGFSLSWDNHRLQLGDAEVDLHGPAVQRYLLPLPVVLWLEEALQYVVSPSGNTAWHLALVVWLVLAYMLVRSFRVQRRFARARSKIPLSVGGWGSRGKSGTERLKSALFHSLHLDVVSKTTGCEAMLIWARRDQAAEELFLYRPYDKATIWEQETAVSYSQQLGAQVFLWECMALNPEFVDILNREWMKDSITTITNAYPDHEDIMGPSGEDVARVVGRFVPKGGTVFSSESQMQAIIRESAHTAGCTMVDVDDLSADLLPRDLLARFPYQEHPRNVALALRLAEHLGVDKERALFDIADYVVPDLGVLKTFPVIHYKGRSIQFSNGMSANERAGFLSNWTRLGFASHRAEETPEAMTVVVVNNRADRVARSRVFAELCARDIEVDRIVVIGTNTSGMRRFLHESAVVQSEGLGEPSTAEEAIGWVNDVFDKLAAPASADCVIARCKLVVRGVAGTDEAPAAVQQALGHLIQQLPSHEPGQQPLQTARTLAAPLAEALGALPDLEGIWAHERSQRVRELTEHLVHCIGPWLLRKSFLGQVPSQGAVPASLVSKLRQCFVESFERKVVVLEDSDAKGDEVIDVVFRSFPPGIHGRIMGCQNIKGTGLDFVYRFMALQATQDQLTKMMDDPAERGSVLGQMLAQQQYGLFDCQLVLRWLEHTNTDVEGWREHEPSLLELGRRLRNLRDQTVAKLGQRKTPSRWQGVVGWFEPWIDNLDGIYRRRFADRVMAQLIQGEIDLPTASSQLRSIVARQKGGWLARDIAGLLAWVQQWFASTPRPASRSMQAAAPGRSLRVTSMVPPDNSR